MCDFISKKDNDKHKDTDKWKFGTPKKDTERDYWDNINNCDNQDGNGDDNDDGNHNDEDETRLGDLIVFSICLAVSLACRREIARD